MDKVKLYSVKNDVFCLKCGGKGAVQPYGTYYPNGVGELADSIKSYARVRNKPYMSDAVGFGGTVPHECLHCGNKGLIDFSGLEGYNQAFMSIRKPKKESNLSEEQLEQIEEVVDDFQKKLLSEKDILKHAVLTLTKKRKRRFRKSNCSYLLCR